MNAFKDLENQFQKSQKPIVPNVGIGTISPGRKLDVEANVAGYGKATIGNLDPGSSAVATLSLAGTSGNVVSIVADGSGSSIFGGLGGAIGTEQNGPFAINTNGIPRITVLAGGNVGIGTTTPSANLKLQVNGAAASAANIINAGGVVDLSLSNVHYLKSVGGSVIALSNMASGGSYTIIIYDPTQQTYSFTGCTNSYFSPTNGQTYQYSSYSILTVVDGANTNCFINWVTGFN